MHVRLPRLPRALAKPLLVAVAGIAIMGAYGPTARGAGTVRWVNNATGLTAVAPGTDCGHPGYTTIQAAVSASAAGDVVTVCPGIYSEQVTIGPAKTGLQLWSVVPQSAVIVAPAVMGGAGDIVHVSGAQNVIIGRFTISGPLPDATICGAALPAGVGVVAGASVNLTADHITQIRATTNGGLGCGQGYGVAVAGNIATSATISGSVPGGIDGYQKVGVLAVGSGAVATTYGLNITGSGAGVNTSQFGIVGIGGGKVIGSLDKISNNGSNSHIGTGTLAFANGTTQLSTETIFGNTAGVAFVASSSNSSLATSYIHNNQFLGVLLAGTDDTLVNHNVVTSNGLLGIVVINSEDNTLTNNTSYFHTVFDCVDNTTDDEATLDDTPGINVDNTWLGNDALTDNPGGICARPHVINGAQPALNVPQIELPSIPAIPAQ